MESFSASSDKIASVLGYAGKDIPEEYLVKIIITRPAYMMALATDTGVSSTGVVRNRKIEIVAPLQDDIATRFEAHWAPLSAARVVTGVADEITQALTSLFGSSRTLMTKWMTRRVWTSTSPLDFTLNLKFQAVYNTMKEVVQPCRELQRLILPYTPSDGGIINELGFLAPPGPRFITTSIKDWGKKVEGEVVDIHIGKYYFIKKCIVVDVSSKTPPRFEKGGNPIGAEMSIHFQTYEIVTKDTLDTDVYNGNPVKEDTPEEIASGT
jgi:hypothetical protein